MSNTNGCCAPEGCGCATKAKHHTASAHAHQAHHMHGTSPLRLASAATLHCLTGCALGELLGLMLGVSLGLSALATVVLATLGGFTSGYLLGLWPLVKRGMSWRSAFAAIWLGETLSIGVMELVMNLVDYHVGGASAGSVLSGRFWLGYALALIAGYLAAWPMNWWLLERHIKAPCH